MHSAFKIAFAAHSMADDNSGVLVTSLFFHLIIQSLVFLKTPLSFFELTPRTIPLQNQHSFSAQNNKFYFYRIKSREVKKSRNFLDLRALTTVKKSVMRFEDKTFVLSSLTLLTELTSNCIQKLFVNLFYQE